MEEYAVRLPLIILALGGVGTLWTLFSVLRKKGRSWKQLVVGPALLFGLYPSMVVTPPGHAAVIYSMWGGISQHERGEGLSFVVPYAQSATMIDVRVQKEIFVDADREGIFAQTFDFLEVTTPISVNWHVDPSCAAWLYQNIGKGYADITIRPALLQVAKAEIGDIDTLDFARERDQLALDIQAGMADRLGTLCVVVDYVAIEDAIFDEVFVDEVLAKETADETAEKEERLVDSFVAKADQVKATADGERYRIEQEAEGQARANRVIDASLTADVLYWQALKSWGGVLPSTVVGGESLDLNQLLLGLG